MTRKPQNIGPTAEDISRHEEAVAKYLAEFASAGLRERWTNLRVSERLALVLGCLSMAMIVRSGRDTSVIEANICRCQEYLYFQMKLEKIQGVR